MMRHGFLALLIAVGVFLNTDHCEELGERLNSSLKATSIYSKHSFNATARPGNNASQPTSQNKTTSRPRTEVISLGFVLRNDRKLHRSLLTAIREMNKNKNSFHGFLINPVVEIVDDTPYDVLQALCNNFTQNHVVGVIFICGEICTKLASLTSYMGVAAVRIAEKYHGHEMTARASFPGTVLDMIPLSTRQNDALVYLLQKFQWRTVCLIHDTSLDSLRLVEDLRRRQTKGNFKIAWKVVIDGSKAGHIAKRLKKMAGKSRVFLLYCGYENTKEILRKAAALKLTGEEYAWLLSDIAINHFEPIPESFPVGLMAVEYHHGHFDDNHIKDSLELAARGIQRVRETGHNLTGSSIGCARTDSVKTKHEALLSREMKKVRFRGKTGFVSFTDDGQRLEARYSYLNLRREKGKGKLAWKNVGYSEANDLSLDQILWPGGVFLTPSGLPRVSLRVVTYEVHPLMFLRDLDHESDTCLVGMDCRLVLKETGDSLPRCCYGMCVDLLDKLSRDLNFLPELVVIQKGMGGSLKHGKWSGLIGEVVSGTADLAMASISITKQRSQYVDFSEPYIHTGTTILVARKSGGFAEDGFLKPFQVTVWLTIFGLLYTVAALIFFLETRNPGLHQRKYKTNPPKFDIHESIWLMYSRLFSGILNAKSPIFVSSRVVLSFWAFLSLIVIAKYTANLAAFMVLRERTEYIEGINDPKMQNPSPDVLRFTTIRNTSVEAYFERNFPAIYKYIKNYHVNNSSEGVQAVRSGKIDAFIWEEVSLRQYVSRDPTCGLLTVGKLFDRNGYGIALQKNSPWTEPISDHILKYQQTSALELMLEKWRLDSCSDNKEELSMGALGETNFLGVFYLLMAGVVGSAVVLGGEHFVYWCFLVNKKQHEQETTGNSSVEKSLCIPLKKSKSKKVENDEGNTELRNLAPFLSELEKDLCYLLRGVKNLQERRSARSQESSSDSYSSEDEPADRKSLSTMPLSDPLRVAYTNHSTSQLTLSNVKRLVKNYKLPNTRDKDSDSEPTDRLSVV